MTNPPLRKWKLGHHKTYAYIYDVTFLLVLFIHLLLFTLMIMGHPWDTPAFLAFGSAVSSVWIFMSIFTLEKAIEHAQEYEKSKASLYNYVKSSTNFENAQVGDTVWSSEYGWGNVVVVNKTSISMPLIVKFKNARITEGYNLNGVRNSFIFSKSTLFWTDVGTLLSSELITEQMISSMLTQDPTNKTIDISPTIGDSTYSTSEIIEQMEKVVKADNRGKLNDFVDF